MFRRPRRLHRVLEHDTKNDKQTAPHLSLIHISEPTRPY